MSQHPLFSRSGLWSGEGLLYLDQNRPLHFHMTWEVYKQNTPLVECVQCIEVESMPEKMYTSFKFEIQGEGAFALTLDNLVIGQVQGEGVLDSRVVSWEFTQDSPSFSGLEIYELQQDGTSYAFKSMFLASPDLRSIMEGKLSWASSFDT